jgi:hypothetical protein
MSIGRWKKDERTDQKRRIGEILRDSHGIAQVRVVTGNKILRILKGSGTITRPS